MHEIEVQYSEALVREALRAFFWRRTKELLDLKILAAAVLVIGGAGWLWLRDQRSWLFGFLVAIAVLGPVVLLSAYAVRYRDSVGRFRRMKNPKARFIIRDADLTVVSDLGSSTVPWSAITELWQFPRFWILLFSGASFVTLPTEGLSESVLSFVRSKVAP